MSNPWFHGTPHYFEAWRRPPPSSTLPGNWVEHSFVSLSADLHYARLHQPAGGGLCVAQLLPGYRVLDLRLPSPESQAVWEQIRATELGARYYALEQLEEWFIACRIGSILRYVLSREEDHPELLHHRRLLNSPTASPVERETASLFVQNFTRAWIELLIGSIGRMGYAAVICNELELARSRSPSTQLFVFDVACLSSPCWLETPAALAEHLDHV